jgi:hypothetical protein
MIITSACSQVLDFFGTALVIEPATGQLSSDAGLLPVRPFDHRIGLTRAFAEALDDPRDPDLTEHTFLEMVHSRVYGILAATRTRTITTPSALTLSSSSSPANDWGTNRRFVVTNRLGGRAAPGTDLRRVRRSR